MKLSGTKILSVFLDETFWDNKCHDEYLIYYYYLPTVVLGT